MSWVFSPTKMRHLRNAAVEGDLRGTDLWAELWLVTVLLFRTHKHQDQQTFKKEIWFHKYLLNSEFAFLSFSLFRKSY